MKSLDVSDLNSLYEIFSPQSKQFNDLEDFKKYIENESLDISLFRDAERFVYEMKTC